MNILRQETGGYLITTSESSKELNAVLVESRPYEDKNKHGTLSRFSVSEIYGELLAYEEGSRLTGEELASKSKAAGMPAEFMSKYAKDINWSYYPERFREDVKKYLNGYILHFPEAAARGKGIFIFSGTSGNGKTLMACTVLNEIMKRHINAKGRFTTAQDYVDLVASKTESERDESKRIRETGLLILDDTIEGIDKDWKKDVLQQLIVYRSDNHYPTIYTADRKIEDLPFPGKTIDRIFSDSFPICVPDVPIRRQIGQQDVKNFVNRILEESAQA